MRMLAAVIDIEIVEQTGADTVLGKHTLYDLGVERMMAVGTHLEALIHQNLGSKFALAAGVACVAQIDAVCKLVASHSDLVGIDDDYIVAAFYVRRKRWLVFSAQDFCDLCAETAENLVGCIDNDPFALDALGVGG